MKALGIFFKMQKGLKQGCTLSPLLFILVVDSVDAILKLTRSGGFVIGISGTRDEWSL